MNLKTFLATLADSSNEIDRLTLAFAHPDIRQRGPAQHQLLRLPSPQVEEKLLELLRAIDYTREHGEHSHEDDDFYWLIRDMLLLREKTVLPSLLKALYDPAFMVREIAVFVLTEIGDPEVFFPIFEMVTNDPLLEQYDAYVTYSLIELAAPQHLDLLLTTLIRGHTEQQKFAINCLANIGLAAIPAVLPLLTQQDAGVRGIVAELLGTLGSTDQKVIDALITTLHDSDTEVRRQAVKALRKLKAQQALPAIMEIIHDADSHVSNEAAGASENLGGPDQFEMHISALQDPDANIRANAIFSLYDDARAFEPLLVALRDPSIGVRIAAAKALYRIGDLRAVEPLIATLIDPKPCDAAAYHLGEFGDPRAVEPLIAAYAAYQNGDRKGAVAPGFSDSYGTTRDTIIQALGKLGDLRATETLITALDDPGAYICHSAIRGLEKLGDRRAVTPLLKLLLERHNISVAEPLVTLGGPQAMEGLYSVLLESPKYPEYLCHHVAQALRTHQQPALDILFNRLYHMTTPKERCKAAIILGALGDFQAFTPLLTILNDTQEELSVRCAAIRALYELDGEQAINPLIAILSSDPSRIIRAQAAATLGKLRQPATLAALLNALEDEAAIVRVNAVLGLQFFDDPEVIPALEMMIAREITRDDDFVDYSEDAKYLLNNMIYAERLPERIAQDVLNSMYL